MALAEGPVPVSGRANGGIRLLRFVGRVVLAVCVASASLSVVERQAPRLADGRLLEDPLTAALRDAGVAVLESDILVVAAVEQGVAPSFSRLKEIAAGVARAMPGFDAERFWTEAADAYRVVYFEGREPGGGRWIASARYVSGSALASGTESGGEGVEVAVFRSFLSVPERIGHMARSTKSLIERALGRPLRVSEATVRLRGRPPSDAEWKEIARDLLSRVGADLRYESSETARYVAAGFSPRLFGRARMGRQTVNVVVSVSRLGMGPWVEVESPAL